MALARILVSEPRAILLDEPFSALDSFLKWHLELELSDLLAEFSGPILCGSAMIWESATAIASPSASWKTAAPAL